MNTIKMCVITEDLTDGADMPNDELTQKLDGLKAQISAIIGSDCIEEHEIEGSFDLWYNAPIAGLNARIDKLNDTVDGVKLAHYRDEFGKL